MRAGAARSGTGVPDPTRALRAEKILEQIPDDFVYMNKAR